LARISGANIPDEKQIFVSLTYIYGIGIPTSLKICKDLEIYPYVRTGKLNESELSKIREYITKNFPTVESDLKRKVSADIKRLIEIGCYRGVRHVKKLPVRGQRTHTNAKTRKGRGVAIANKKKAVK